MGARFGHMGGGLCRCPPSGGTVLATPSCKDELFGFASNALVPQIRLLLIRKKVCLPQTCTCADSDMQVRMWCACEPMPRQQGETNHVLTFPASRCWHPSCTLALDQPQSCGWQSPTRSKTHARMNARVQVTPQCQLSTMTLLRGEEGRRCDMAHLLLHSAADRQELPPRHGLPDLGDQVLPRLPWRELSPQRLQRRHVAHIAPCLRQHLLVRTGQLLQVLTVLVEQSI